MLNVECLVFRVECLGPRVEGLGCREYALLGSSQWLERRPQRLEPLAELRMAQVSASIFGKSQESECRGYRGGIVFKALYH